MRRLSYLILLPAAITLALVVAAPAAADAPTIERSTVTFAPFVDDETCAFPFSVTVERTRTTISYANGDIKRHTDLVVTSSANGKTVIGRNSVNVFIEAESPTVWVITGVFEKAQLHGRTLWLQSGRLLFDLEADQVSDAHRGPLSEPPDVCQSLAP